MTQQTAFDPEKPIAKFTACGKTPVRNVRVGAEHIHAEYQPGENWCRGAWNLDGTSGKIGSKGPFDIVNEPPPAAFPTEFAKAMGEIYAEPEPQPAVDWEREIQRRDGKYFPRLLATLAAAECDQSRVIKGTKDDGTEFAYCVLENGRTHNFQENPDDIINRPVPPKTLRVEIAGATCKSDGEFVVFQDNMETGLLRGLFSNGHSTSVFDGSDRRLRAAVHYDIGPWQTIELPMGN